MPTTPYIVANTADLNAAIQAIDLTGTASAPNTDYAISVSGVVQKCNFQVTPEIDRTLMLRGSLVLGVTLI